MVPSANTSEADLTAIELERRLAEVRAMEIRAKIAEEFADDDDDEDGNGGRLSSRGRRLIEGEMERAGRIADVKQDDKENTDPMHTTEAQDA